ncbi:MAG: SDR family NAD(P)-dependent oxidoreductase [Myxococcota bacterium]
MDFSNRAIVVTGGTGALGTAVVAAALQAGATIHIPAFETAVREGWPHHNHPNVHITTSIDLSDEDAVVDFYASIDGLWASIHCAGGFAMAPLTETSLADFRKMMGRNLDSAFLCCREAVRAFRRRDDAVAGGRLVNVASRQALEPRIGGGMLAYTTSKAAVAAMTQALAQELSREGIWVNAIAPSIIDTPANRRSMPNADHETWPSPADLAASILWLASPDNRVSRGGVLPLYGQV